MGYGNQLTEERAGRKSMMGFLNQINEEELVSI